MILKRIKRSSDFLGKKTNPHPLGQSWIRHCGASSLAHSGDFRQVYLAPDERLDVRRRNMLDRLKRRAERAGLSVTLSNGILSIDGNVFSLERGYLASRYDFSPWINVL